MKDILFVYRIFNFWVTSNIPLPELPLAKHQNNKQFSKITFNLSNLPLTSVEKPRWFHSWFDDEENTEVTIRVARLKGHYLLRFPGLADFTVDLINSNIQCYPAPDTPDETIRHLLLDQVIPRYIGQQGKLILHASAVELANGQSIAFFGKSSWGKSTIASSFYQNGAHLLTDDSLLLTVEDGDLRAISAYAGSRLWQDSADIVFPDSPNLPLVTHYSDKKRLILNENNSSPIVDLQAIFLLNSPLEKTELSGTKIEPIDGADIIMAMLTQTFLIDVEDMGVVAKQFGIASQIAQIKPAIYTLSYAREYSQLASLRAAILSVV